MTALKDALQKAGYDTVTADLRRMINDAMDKAKNNVPRALAAFRQAEKTEAHWDEIERYYFVNNLPQARDPRAPESSTVREEAPPSTAAQISVHARLRGPQHGRGDDLRLAQSWNVTQRHDRT
jgi:hypothetical protein